MQDNSESEKIRKENQNLKAVITDLTDQINYLKQKAMQEIDTLASLNSKVQQAEEKEAALDAAQLEIQRLRERLAKETAQHIKQDSDAAAVRRSPQMAPRSPQRVPRSTPHVPRSPNHVPRSSHHVPTSSFDSNGCGDQMSNIRSKISRLEKELVRSQQNSPARQRGPRHASADPHTPERNIMYGIRAEWDYLASKVRQTEELETKLQRQKQEFMEEKQIHEEEYVEKVASMQKMLEVYISHSTPVDKMGVQALESIEKAEYAEVDPNRKHFSVVDDMSLKNQLSKAQEKLSKLRENIKLEHEENKKLAKHNAKLAILASQLESEIKKTKETDRDDKKCIDQLKQELKTMIETKSYQLLELFTEVERKNSQLDGRITKANEAIEISFKDLLGVIGSVTSSRPSDASGQLSDRERQLADLNAENMVLKNRLTVSDSSRNSIEQQLTDRVNKANAEIQRLIGQNSELRHELERKSEQPNVENPNELTPPRISIFPPQQLTSPRGTHVTTETQTDTHATDDKQRSKKQQARQELDTAQQMVQWQQEQIRMVWEDIFVREDVLVKKVRSFFAQEEYKIQLNLNQALEREKVLKGQVAQLCEQIKDAAVQSDHLRSDLETQQKKANRLSEEFKKMGNKELNSVERILDNFAGQNLELQEQLQELDQSHSKTSYDLTEDAAPEIEEFNNLSNVLDQDISLPSLVGFLDSSNADKTKIPTSFSFCRKAMYEGISWCLIEPMGQSQSWWKEDDLVMVGNVLPDEDTEETLLNKIHKVLKLQVGDNLIDAISNLSTSKERERGSSCDRSRDSSSNKIATEQTYRLQKVISDLRKEIEDYESQQSLLQSSISVLKSEIATLNEKLSNTERFESDSSTDLKSIRDIFEKFAHTIPMGKQDSDSLLRILFSLLNFSKDEQEKIDEIRAKKSKPPRKPGLFNMFGRKD